jgi:hypothetical protein
MVNSNEKTVLFEAFSFLMMAATLPFLMQVRGDQSTAEERPASGFHDVS